jgi:hypothetical protein
MKFFDIHISDKNKNIISQINIERDIDPFVKQGWPSYDKDPYEDIKQGIKDTGDNSDEICHHGAQIISEMIKLGIDKLKRNMKIDNYNVILWLRFETPTEYFILPRWHTDANYFVNGNTRVKSQMKILMSLKGPGTLLAKCDNNSSIIQQIKKVSRDHSRYENSENIQLENELIKPILDKNCTKHQLQNYQGAMYYVGNHDDSGIHYEPNKNESRLLLGILVNEL